MGIVVLRNILERRGELGLLLAVGFRRRTLQAMALSEHGVLLLLGLGIGILAAAVAVLPSVITPGASVPYRSLALTLSGVLLNGRSGPGSLPGIPCAEISWIVLETNNTAAFVLALFALSVEA